VILLYLDMGRRCSLLKNERTAFVVRLPRLLISTSYGVGSPGFDCAATCAQVEGGQSECSARAIVAVNNDADLAFVKAAFAEAGVICTSVSAGDKGVTGTPAYRGDHCITTGGSSESGLSYCIRPIAAPYQRLCACTR